MLIITEKELKQKFLSDSENNLIQIQSNNLKEGVSFAKKLKGAALDLVKEYLDNNRFCLLVENDSYWTIWHELI
ncbi:MAG: hypothetical protein QNJ54_08590 [Prochloraceae cyanobacterium]|nr:hypothetical protein [Prochloraceae cyanobacterium]